MVIAERVFWEIGLVRENVIPSLFIDDGNFVRGNPNNWAIFCV